MVRLNTITTKTGDDGTTGLADGSRVPKYNLRIDAIGTVDEANAAIGTARALVADREASLLMRVQNDLFDLGADLAVPQARDDVLRIAPSQTEWLEAEQGKLNEALRPLNSFVLPGGAKVAAQLHLARTVVRRAERVLVALMAEESINPEIVRYMNRLSDFLFILARHCNDMGERDVLWQPGKNRQE
jgi:cob(I)alamin adenosyltransferase